MKFSVSYFAPRQYERHKKEKEMRAPSVLSEKELNCRKVDKSIMEDWTKNYEIMERRANMRLWRKKEDNIYELSFKGKTILYTKVTTLRVA